MGSRLGLLVVQVLDAVLHLAQKTVGVASIGGGLGHQARAGQTASASSVGAPATRKLAAAHHLQQLHGEFTSRRMPPRDSLTSLACSGRPAARFYCMVRICWCNTRRTRNNTLSVGALAEHKRHHVHQGPGQAL